MTATASSIAADVTVVGAGAAGLYTALCAARTGARVALVSATPLAATASYWAQGGLAAALAEDDSPEQHLRDTEVAGRGAVRPSAARVLVDEAPDKVRDLLELGVRFDVDADGGLSLGLEGGHTRRRVAHAGGSATGPAHRPRPLRPGRRASGHHRARAGARRRAARAGGPLSRRRPRGRPRRPVARDRARHRGRRGALVAHDEPAGVARDRPRARARGGRRPRRPRVPAVPPDRGHRRPAPRGLPGHGGDPRRGRHAARSRTASASSTSWRRATRSRGPLSPS